MKYPQFALIPTNALDSSGIKLRHIWLNVQERRTINDVKAFDVDLVTLHRSQSHYG